MTDSFATPTPRRGFLGRLAVTAAALGLGSSLPATLVALPLNSTGTGVDPALEAWFGKISGKHRQLFDAPYAHEGMAAVWPQVYMLTMGATYPGEKGTAVVILRHEAIPLAMEDSLWAKYDFGEMFSIKAGDAPATSNPFATITGLPIPGLGITELLKAGVLIGVCDAAMSVYSSAAAKRMSLEPAAVKKEWVDGLYAGIQPVPSGVMAVGRAQEMGCGYCFAG